MTVQPLDGAAIGAPPVPDAAPSPQGSQPTRPGEQNDDAFGRALDALGAILDSADASEDAFAAGHGSLQDAMYDRARADVALNVAVTAAQRCAQTAQTILNMQV